MIYPLPPKSNPKRYLLYLLFSLFFAIGIIGYLQLHLPFADALYNTIKLITLNGEQHVENWQLELARFALPLFTFAAIVKLVLKAIGLRLTYLTLRLFPADTLVFGANVAIVEVSIFASHLGKRLFIDISPQGIHYPGQLPTKGYKLLHLPELSFQHLLKLPLASAQNIYFIAPKDEVNLAMAKSVIPLLQKATKKPHLFINLTSQLMQRMANQEQLFQRYRLQQGDITWMNTEHQLARILLQERAPLPYASVNVGEKLHIGLLGFTSLTRQLILTMMRNCAYLHIKQVHISVLSPDPAQYQQFLQENPILTAHSADNKLFGSGNFPIYLQHYPCHIPQLSPKLVADILAEKGAFHHLYIHHENDYMSLELVHKMRQILTALQAPYAITACLNGRHLEDYQALNEKAALENSETRNLCYFSIIDHYRHYCKNQVYDILPLIIHTAYQAIQQSHLPPMKSTTFATQFAQAFLDSIEPCKTHWREALQEEFRHSSRCAADHLLIKLRELGFTLRYQPNNHGQDSLYIAELHHAIQQQLDALLRLEHQRFYQERITDGWIYAEKSDEKQQLHCSLVAFEQLSPQEKQKDESLIRLIPFMLSQPMVQRYYQLVPLVMPTGSPPPPV
ncbi:RyR domain-containing protein [Pasteurella sp. PK-2025]|uniref:RyR domain-containing protein n=1 Tax=Pasteurella sp. PK-2025 TaxID=3413133 RepID=UPI003C76ABF3